MDAASVYYLGVTFLLFAIFAAIWIRTYSRKHKEKGEAPKYRMMDDEWEESGSGSTPPGAGKEEPPSGQTGDGSKRKTR